MWKLYDVVEQQAENCMHGKNGANADCRQHDAKALCHVALGKQRRAHGNCALNREVHECIRLDHQREEPEQHT